MIILLKNPLSIFIDYLCTYERFGKLLKYNRRRKEKGKKKKKTMTRKTGEKEKMTEYLFVFLHAKKIVL